VIDLKLAIVQIEHAVNYWNEPGISIAEAWGLVKPILEAAGKVSERDFGRVIMGFVSTEMRELLEAIKAALPDEVKK